MEELKVIRATLDEHGRLIGENSRRIRDVDLRTGRLAIVVYGDSEQDFRGLVERMKVADSAIEEFTEWRHTIQVRWETTLTLIRLGLIVMTVTGAGVWLPILSKLIQELNNVYP